MGLTYTIDRQRRLLTTVWTGTVTGEDMVALYLEIFALPDFDGGFDELVDLSQAKIVELTADHMQRAIAARLRRFGKARTRTAVIAPKDVQFGKARMYNAYSDMAEGEDVMPFRDRAEALAWLDGNSGERV